MSPRTDEPRHGIHSEATLALPPAGPARKNSSLSRGHGGSSFPWVMAMWLSGLMAIGLLLLGGCSPAPLQDSKDSDFRTATTASEPESAKGGWLVEVGRQTGLDFRHQDGRSGRRHYVETVASGGGWLDFDRDGDLDIYLLNGAATPGSHLEGTPRNALFEQRDGRWIDVTERAGVGDTGYGMGMCVGDVDADGWIDFFITNYGEDRLFHNLGDGTFKEISGPSGVDGKGWGTNCAFADLDADGDLDLYVTNYVQVDLERAPSCRDPARSLESYCRPVAFDGQPDYLYLNRGDGTFEQVAHLRGIDQGLEDRGFGVVITDLSGDGAPDILVANDGTDNRFYVNDGKGYFEDRSLITGLGLNRNGRAESGMGLEVADVDRDGLQDLAVTNYSFESHTLYLQRPNLFFEDRTVEAGLEAGSYLNVGWGLQAFDADNDGDLDLAVVNGHVLDNIELLESGIGYAQPNQVWLNRGDGTFEDVSAQAGAPWVTPKVSRGLAVGDWNNDGKLDLLVTHTNDRPEIFENRLQNDHHWVGFHLVGPPTNPIALGARLTLRRGDELLGLQEVRSGGSFLSQRDLRLHFGLGDTTGPLTADLLWPDGHRQVTQISDIDRYLTITYEPNS